MYTPDTVGLIHLLAAIFSMIFGASVIFLRKGTKAHIRLGYAYGVSMIILIITAFMIYRLSGGFGPFHVAAIISFLTLLGGMIPVILKKPENNWLDFHYEFMNWSIVGLFAAFWSETFSRFFPFEGFWTVVITATLITVMAGVFFIKSKKKTVLSKYMR
jgi:uncharacterized membrane protein